MAITLSGAKVVEQRTRTLFLNLNAETLAYLRKRFTLAQVNPGNGWQLLINDSLVTIRRAIEDAQPVTLDWHDADAVQSFSARLTFYAGLRLVESAMQLRREEREANVHAGAFAHELAQKIASGVTGREFIAWQEAYDKEMRKEARW